MFNSVMFLGQLMNEIEVKTSQSGKEYIRFELEEVTDKTNKTIATIVCFSNNQDLFEKVKAAKVGDKMLINGQLSSSGKYNNMSIFLRDIFDLNKIPNETEDEILF